MRGEILAFFVGLQQAIHAGLARCQGVMRQP